ncbi:hypothetical protein Tco_0448787 [Tanacetum coccineum]
MVLSDDDVRIALNDRLKGIRMEYLPQTFWSQRDKVNARAMIQAIDKRLKTRRIMRSLERFVGGRPYGEHAEYDESNTYVLERFNTTAGNPVKKILLKLNLSDHRKLKEGGEDTAISAEKMQKEKEQQDKLKAIKARLLYGNESGRNPRNHEESHYSESKTPTARTDPRRRHGRKHSQNPLPVASVFRRLKQNRPPSLRLWPRKEGGVFNRLGRKEPGTYTRSDSHHQSSQEKGTKVPARKHHHEGTSSRRTSGYSESEDSEGGH